MCSAPLNDVYTSGADNVFCAAAEWSGYQAQITYSAPRPNDERLTGAHNTLRAAPNYLSLAIEDNVFRAAAQWVLYIGRIVCMVPRP